MSLLKSYIRNIIAEGGKKVAWYLLLLVLVSSAALSQVSNLGFLQILSIFFYFFVPGYLASTLIKGLEVWERILVSLGMSIGMQQGLQILLSLSRFNGLAASKISLIIGAAIVIIIMLFTSFSGGRPRQE
jgi:uncharacterized membrane protein